MAGALAYRWDGRRSSFVFRTQTDNFKADGIVAFLRVLKRHFRGRQVILLWDRLPGHKAAKTQEYLRTQRHWLRVEWLPAYAPDLNPVELVWGHGKGEIANQLIDDLDDVTETWRRALRRIAPPLARAFLRHTGLLFA